MTFYRFLLLVMIAAGTLTTCAQELPADKNLESKLVHAKSTVEAAKLYYEFGDERATQDSLSSIAYIRKGLQLAKGNNYTLGLGYFYLGRAYMEFSRGKAAVAFDTAIHYLGKVNSPESYICQSRSWANKAIIAQLNGDNKTHIKLFLEKAIPLAAKGGDSLRMADGYTNVSLPFMNYGEYDKAILYLNKSAVLFKRLAPNDLRQIDIYCHLAKIYLLQDKVTEAGNNLRLAGLVLRQDSESFYAPNYHTIESMYLIRLKQWKTAEQSIKKGLSIAEKLKNRYEVRLLLYQKADLFRAQHNWTASRDVLLKMYQEGYVELNTDKKQLYDDLAKLESHLGNYKQAYDWMLKHKTISEQVYARQTSTQIADLETRYNYVQKEKELLLAKEKSERQQRIIWITVLAFLFALTVIYFWYKNRKIRAIQALKQQQQNELGKALLEGEERERSRLARDLHDGLGGMLAGIKLSLSQMMENNNSIADTDLQQPVERLGSAVEELRRISRNMMPESLVRSGLYAALKDLCEETNTPRLKVKFNAFDVHENYLPQVQLFIYRIVQELVHNAVKHAWASKIMVQCSHAENTFFITVEDNGKGFSPDLSPAKGSGLKNIKSRVSFLNGSMHIESNPEGTIINIELYV